MVAPAPPPAVADPAAAGAADMADSPPPLLEEAGGFVAYPNDQPGVEVSCAMWVRSKRRMGDPMPRLAAPRTP